MRSDGDGVAHAAIADDADGAEEPLTWVSAGPGDGSLPRTEAVKDERTRRWDVATPAATKIGRARRPEEDVSENLRRLHDEQHPAMAGHSSRMHRLDKVRIAHAVCSALELTPWERDRVLGIMIDLDLTAFGSQRAIPKVTLVVVQYVVDGERRRQLGLDDTERLSDLPEDRLESLYERFTSIKDEDAYRRLLEENDLGKTNVNRLNRVLREQLDEQDLGEAALGRHPFEDPNLPYIRDRKSDGAPTLDGDLSGE